MEARPKENSAGKFFVQTFGCRANQADSAALLEDLVEHRYAQTDSLQDADFVIVNSCTVTHRSDQDVRQWIRRAHRENPGAPILVTGCYAQREPQELTRLEGVRWVVGNELKTTLSRFLRAEREKPQLFSTDISKARELHLAPAWMDPGRTRPFLKIQDGCDACCAYCIIPVVRGAGRSVPPEEVLATVRRLVEDGYKEIVLTGIHLGSYGRKLETPVHLAALIEQILKTPGMRRVRLSAIEPMRFSKELVHLAIDNPRLAPHFHLPLQSGSNRILSLMKRPYTAERYSEWIHYIHERVPDAALGTDVLVGFPGETDEDHARTTRLVEMLPLTYLHVFPFSDRPGTAATSMPGHLDPRSIAQRARQLREISEVKRQRFAQRFLGKVRSAVTLSETQEGFRTALTDNYIEVRVPAELPANEILDLRLGHQEAGQIYALPAEEDA